MAALLVMVAVLSILMSAAMPVWRRESQREKEEELVFRGQQYVRAIRLYQAKTRAFPPSIDALVQGRYLRKKYKDPITNDDFIPIGAAAAGAGQVGINAQPGRGGSTSMNAQPGQGRSGSSQPTQQTPFASSAFGPESGNTAGGIIGVVSKSKDESIRIYMGRTHYNEWQFVFVNAQPGGPGGIGGRGVPGGPGGQPVPGGPGRGGRRGGNDGRGMPFPGGGRGDSPIFRGPGRSGGPG
jgi:type II secretory pathway pseudopilin PulG